MQQEFITVTFNRTKIAIRCSDILYVIITSGSALSTMRSPLPFPSAQESRCITASDAEQAGMYLIL